jgi:hypothetical protein
MTGIAANLSGKLRPVTASLGEFQTSMDNLPGNSTERSEQAEIRQSRLSTHCIATGTQFLLML